MDDLYVCPWTPSETLQTVSRLCHLRTEQQIPVCSSGPLQGELYLSVPPHCWGGSAPHLLSPDRVLLSYLPLFITPAWGAAQTKRHQSP